MEISVESLIGAVIEKKNHLSYINLDEDNKYQGWTHDFGLVLPDKKKMELNLHNISDRFLLFVLASSWSRTGQWENATFFVTYLKEQKKHHIEHWLDEKFVEEEKKNSKNAAKYATAHYEGIVSRRKISFRVDFYDSCMVLAKNWNRIEEHLERSEKSTDYRIFIEYISNVKGLGARENKMKIKIPLILRELRCQRVYKHIPGKFCCVTDKRVIDAAKKMGMNELKNNTLINIIKSSEIIYDNFGDLYDIPLFAYEDLIGKSKEGEF